MWKIISFASKALQLFLSFWGRLHLRSLLACDWSAASLDPVMQSKTVEFLRKMKLWCVKTRCVVVSEIKCVFLVDLCWWFKQFASPTWERRKQNGVKRFPLQYSHIRTSASHIPASTWKWEKQKLEVYCVLFPHGRMRRGGKDEEDCCVRRRKEGEKKRVWEKSYWTQFTANLTQMAKVACGEESGGKSTTWLPPPTPPCAAPPLFDTFTDTDARKAQNTQFISIHSVFKTGKTSCSSF